MATIRGTADTLEKGQIATDADREREGRKGLGGHIGIPLLRRVGRQRCTGQTKLEL